MIQQLEEKILARDRVALGRAITLNESTRIEDNRIIDEIIERHSSKLNQSLVISISGIPGVGKSSFIETFGIYLNRLGKSIAVFSIDPSSEITQGSILGDKTRMNELSRLDDVFIRPSPSSNRLGGLGINTHKNIELAKIAGFDIILVETVGVGQSETVVKNLCDIFILLLMPASGDELQGIKKGIMEVADFYIIHKADGDLEELAQKSKKEIELALHLTKSETNINENVFNFSSIEPKNTDLIWQSISDYAKKLQEGNLMTERRTKQRQYWLKESFNHILLNYFLAKYRREFQALLDETKKGKYIGIDKIYDLIN